MYVWSFDINFNKCINDLFYSPIAIQLLEAIERLLRKQQDEIFEKFEDQASTVDLALQHVHTKQATKPTAVVSYPMIIRIKIIRPCKRTLLLPIHFQKRTTGIIEVYFSPHCRGFRQSSVTQWKVCMFELAPTHLNFFSASKVSKIIFWFVLVDYLCT